MTTTNNNNNYGCGIGFFAILTLIFVVAKLVGFVEWPWVIVFLPVIINFVIALCLIVVVAVGAIIFHED